MRLVRDGGRDPKTNGRPGSRRKREIAKSLRREHPHGALWGPIGMLRLTFCYRESNSSADRQVLGRPAIVGYARNSGSGTDNEGSQNMGMILGMFAGLERRMKKATLRRCIRTWDGGGGFALERMGVTQLVSRKGDRLDNAKAENFFSMVKTEFYCDWEGGATLAAS